MSRAIEVFVVDDHRLFRAGVRAELGTHVTIVGDAGEVDTAIQRIRALKPDVVLIDVHMPQGGGRAVIEAVRETHPDIRFLAVSVSDAAEDVIRIIRAGARGYVTKTIAPEDLVEAIVRVHQGDAVFGPRLAGFVLDAFANDLVVGVGDHDDDLDQLTTREKEVLRHIARGYTYREVGSRLSISVKTVDSHVSAVLRKLQLSNRHELTAWAAGRDLL